MFKLPILKKQLYPYQRTGVKLIELFKGRALLADEMGLGKTIQSLTWLEYHPEIRPVLIIVPSYLKQNWMNEIISSLNTVYKIEILQGTKPYNIHAETNIVIINYDIIRHWVIHLKKYNPMLIILDEIHYIMNSSTKRTQSVRSVCNGVPYILGLSGTPIMNRPIEIFSPLSIIKPGLFPSKFRFAQLFCKAKKTIWGWDFNGASNTKELNNILTNECMIRRLKEDVLPDLPSKIEIPIILDIDLNEYNKVLHSLQEWLETNYGKEHGRSTDAIMLAKIEYLKQAAVQGKMDSIINWIDNFLTQNSKLVIFGTHQRFIKDLHENYKKNSVAITGATPAAKRHDYVNLFQNNKSINLLIGNIRAAGTGFTLTAASNLVFIEFDWNPSWHDQAKDRIHRIGQKDSVSIYYMIAKDTIEEDIMKILDSKREIKNQILDGRESENTEMLTYLVEKILENGNIGE